MAHEEQEMLENLCCCTVTGIILLMIFFWIMGRMGRVRVMRTGGPAPGVNVGEESRGDEIIMMRCGHCDGMYDERLDRCPKCGGR